MVETWTTFNTFDVNKELDQFGELIKLLNTRKEGFVK